MVELLLFFVTSVALSLAFIFFRVVFFFSFFVLDEFAADDVVERDTVVCSSSILSCTFSADEGQIMGTGLPTEFTHTKQYFLIDVPIGADNVEVVAKEI